MYIYFIHRYNIYIYIIQVRGGVHHYKLLLLLYRIHFYTPCAQRVLISILGASCANRRGRRRTIETIIRYI